MGKAIFSRSLRDLRSVIRGQFMPGIAAVRDGHDVPLSMIGLQYAVNTGCFFSIISKKRYQFTYSQYSQMNKSPEKPPRTGQAYAWRSLWLPRL
jgi:hypothetical protein